MTVFSTQKASTLQAEAKHHPPVRLSMFFSILLYFLAVVSVSSLNNLTLIVVNY